MSNKHINHKHGLVGIHGLQPKSKMSKRANKAKAKIRKAVLLKALDDAKKAKA